MLKNRFFISTANLSSGWLDFFSGIFFKNSKHSLLSLSFAGKPKLKRSRPENPKKTLLGAAKFIAPKNKLEKTPHITLQKLYPFASK